MATDPATTPSLLTLFLEQRPSLLRRVTHVVKNDAVAEEIVQETFIKLWTKGVGGDAAGLLHRTAMNLALDHLRASKVRQRHVETSGDDESSTPSAETHAEQQQAWEGIVQLLAGLPERPRRVFLANRVEGRTYASIAQDLGVSVSTVEKDMMLVMRLTREWLLRQRET